jgi:hypothetical protein
MTTPAPHETLFDRIAALLPFENRQEFYRRMTHLRNLGPNDEILQLAEAMGYLALITRQAPVEIAAERTKIEELLEKAMAELEHSLNAHNIAALLSESLRAPRCRHGCLLSLCGAEFRRLAACGWHGKLRHRLF